MVEFYSVAHGGHTLKPVAGRGIKTNVLFLRWFHEETHQSCREKLFQGELVIVSAAHASPGSGESIRHNLFLSICVSTNIKSAEGMR